MEVKDIIALSVGGIILVGFIVYMVVNQKSKIMEWLKYAVVEAEKFFGGGTGQLKLRQVYEWFCTQFPIIAAIVPFKVFSAWVDIALETMKEWLEHNGRIAMYVISK